MRHGPHPRTVPQTVFLPQFKIENSTNYIFCYFPAKKACQVPQTRLLNDLAAAAATCGKVAQLVRSYGSYPLCREFISPPCYQLTMAVPDSYLEPLRRFSISDISA